MADIQADANADPGAVDALARVGYVLQTSAEIIQVFIHCARDDLTAPASLFEEADLMIAKLFRYAGRLRD